MTQEAPIQAAEVPRVFLERILSPYKSHCRYVTRASAERPADGADPRTPWVCRMRAELAIPESCYIDDTGHLNTVEVNIGFNQLLYLLLAQSVERRWLPELEGMDLALFEKRYLPDVLIHRIHGSFKRVIHRERFDAELTFVSAARAKRFVLLHCESRFWDEQDGLATFDVTVAFMRNGW